MRCDPDICPNCMYIGDGDSLCDVLQEIVLEDWTPTEHFKGPGCPYRQKKRHGNRRHGRAQRSHAERNSNIKTH